MEREQYKNHPTPSMAYQAIANYILENSDGVNQACLREWASILHTGSFNEAAVTFGEASISPTTKIRVQARPANQDAIVKEGGSTFWSFQLQIEVDIGNTLGSTPAQAREFVKVLNLVVSIASKLEKLYEGVTLYKCVESAREAQTRKVETERFNRHSVLDAIRGRHCKGMRAGQCREISDEAVASIEDEFGYTLYNASSFNISKGDRVFSITKAKDSVTLKREK